MDILVYIRCDDACWLHCFARAALTKDHTLGGFNSRDLLSPSSGSEKSKDKLWQQSWLLPRPVRESLSHPPALASGTL